MYSVLKSVCPTYYNYAAAVMMGLRFDNDNLNVGLITHNLLHAMHVHYNFTAIDHVIKTQQNGIELTDD